MSFKAYQPEGERHPRTSMKDMAHAHDGNKERRSASDEQHEKNHLQIGSFSASEEACGQQAHGPNDRAFDVRFLHYRLER